MGLMIIKYGGNQMIGDGEGGDDDDGDAGERFVPPVNFANVEDRVYRSGFPQVSNFGFLETLELRSIM